MHKRLLPTVNAFVYGIYYLALPLSKLTDKIITDHLAVNRFSLLSFYEKDHGAHEGKAEDWARNILTQQGIHQNIDEILLISMPSILGYVFNPISLWFCLDKNQDLKAVICEVNNTFGEAHSYLCALENGKTISKDDWLEAKKLFHVSPFLEREGSYKFRFSLIDKKLGIWIDYYNALGEKQLVTSLIGYLQPLTKWSLVKVFFKYPLVSFKTIMLIHWQALKIIRKGIKYIPKPTQKDQKLSIAKAVSNDK